MAHVDGKWQGHNLFCRAVLAALEETLRAGQPAEAGASGEPAVRGRVVMLVGVNGLSRALAAGVQRAGAIPVVAGRDKSSAQALAQSLGCRFVHGEAVYSTLHEVLVRCDDTELHPGFLKPGMTVVDVAALPRESGLLSEAGQRGCRVVSPQQVLVELVNRQTRAVVGETVPREFLLETLRPLIED
jgi:shikimate 5-dehydrogenase